ncbi:MAG: EFR1 family ferrodoxin [Clostridiaceae bacterium]
MKGLIIYLSGTGNTKLAAEYIAANVKNIKFDFHDMNNLSVPDINQYDLLGFATFTQMFSTPKYVESFIKRLDEVENKYAFVFNTYGLINGNTLSGLANFVKNKGYKVIGGFALHTPESSPVMIGYKITSKNSPNDKELKEFNHFIKELDNKAKKIKEGRDIKEIPIDEKKVFTMINKAMSDSSLAAIGEKSVDKSKCIKCKKCEKKCPYDVVYFENEYPKFDEIKCESCFICYNKCPTQAIYSKKHKTNRYIKPNDNITRKLTFKK